MSTSNGFSLSNLSSPQPAPNGGPSAAYDYQNIPRASHQHGRSFDNGATPIRRPPVSVTGSVDRRGGHMNTGGGTTGISGGRGYNQGGRGPGAPSQSAQRLTYNDEDEDEYEDDDDASGIESSIDGDGDGDGDSITDFRTRPVSKGKRKAPAEVHKYIDDDGVLSDFNDGEKHPGGPSRGSRAPSIAGTERSGYTRTNAGGPGPTKRRRLAGGRSAHLDSPAPPSQPDQPDDPTRSGKTAPPARKELGLRRQAAPLGLSGILGLEMADVKEFKYLQGTLGERAKEHRGMMALMYRNTTPEQQERQEALRRANFKHSDVRSVLEHLCGVNSGDKVSRMVAAVAKTFVMELVEEALAYKAEMKHSGALRPNHLLEAFKRCAGAKFGEDVDRAFGEERDSFFGGS